MTKKAYCERESLAYYSGLNGIEIKGIEYENGEEYIYCVSGAWGGKKRAHRLKVYYTAKGAAFFMLDGYRIPLDECISMN